MDDPATALIATTAGAANNAGYVYAPRAERLHLKPLLLGPGLILVEKIGVKISRSARRCRHHIGRDAEQAVAWGREKWRLRNLPGLPLQYHPRDNLRGIG
jgi:hypothetical protein